MATNIVRFERLRGNPRNPNMDQTWWEADVASESAFYKIHIWVQGAGNTDDDWAHSELEKLAQMYTPGQLYGYNPFELQPGRDASPAPGGKAP